MADSLPPTPTTSRRARDRAREGDGAANGGGAYGAPYDDPAAGDALTNGSAGGNGAALDDPPAGNGGALHGTDAIEAAAAAAAAERRARQAAARRARSARRARATREAAPPEPLPVAPEAEPAPFPLEEPTGPKVKRLRLALILTGLSILAFISLVFGMLMAVASDLPSLENTAEYQASRNSTMLDRGGNFIAKLTGNNNRILLREGEISPNVENAVIAMEDRRFFEHRGVDYRGMLRALGQDLKQGGAVQGGSTITQQFVKNALEAQQSRTVFQKLRESALAYHLERRWSKRKILTQYLNTVYFGNGAYGVESAMRTYFGDGQVFGRDDRAAQTASPAQGALLAAIIASPTGYDPVQNPKAAIGRRNGVLQRMLEQKMITQPQYDDAVKEALPSEDDVNPPKPESRVPYFSTWLTQQLVDRYGSGRVFGGGLKVKTTLDMELQEAAEQAIDSRLNYPGGPTASLVAIENKTGAVKAMVGGSNFEDKPFNVATNGHRQPGSAMKPFILVEALRRGVSPGAVYASHKKIFDVPGDKNEKFVVNNYEDQYLGSASLVTATAKSDNSVYAELGLKMGTKRVARMAQRMGIRTPVSTNPAMTLGGLKEGLTPLEMAYAYSTIANRGVRRSGTLGPEYPAPTAIHSVEGPGLEHENEVVDNRVFPREVGEQARQMLAGVITGGTGKNASVPGHFVWGKTGTTENYGDAWFCGGTDKLTVCVWVGYADKLRYMKTEYQGGPVAGGTFPADIFRAFMMSAIEIDQRRHPDRDQTPVGPAVPGAPAPSTPAPAPAPEQAPSGPPAPQQQQPAPTPSQPPPSSPPSGGGGGGTGGAGQ